MNNFTCSTTFVVNFRNKFRHFRTEINWMEYTFSCLWMFSLFVQTIAKFISSILKSKNGRNRFDLDTPSHADMYGRIQDIFRGKGWKVTILNIDHFFPRWGIHHFFSKCRSCSISKIPGEAHFPLWIRQCIATGYNLLVKTIDFLSWKKK